MQILPSYPAPHHGPAGLELAPFRGVRYAQDRVSGLAEVTSPPYDVIFEDKENQLMAADPHNVVRLILPRPVPGHPVEAYRHAAQTLASWQDEQILVSDPAPALYVYEQYSTDEAGEPWLQRGLIGAVRLTGPQAKVVLPHEGVYPGPVAGRLALMEATQANLEPIFLLYDGLGEPGAEGSASTSGAAARIVAETAGSDPLIQARTSDGTRHRLWAITDADDLASIADDLAPRQALIADGHHRYAAYLRLQARRHQAGDGPGPWDYGLALLVDSARYPPMIRAIHRVVPGLDVHQAAKLASTAFSVRALPGGSEDMTTALAALAAASDRGPAYVVAGDRGAYLLTDPDPDQVRAAMPPDRSEQWRALSAAVLQELLLTRVWELSDDEDAVRVVHHDADAAVRTALACGGTAVLCSPMSPGEVYAVAARGEQVPHKSTSFAPKPRTGLVLRLFALG